MPNDQIALQRPVLAYPSIEIDDVNWLKATLVCFPRVIRMHPRECVPHDGKGVDEFVQFHGQDGKRLLDSEFMDPLDKKNEDGSPAYNAQAVLREELQKNLEYVKQRFAPDDNGNFKDGVEPYKMLVAKLNQPFYQFLQTNGLVYDENKSDPELYNFHTLRLHPQLGDAIMTLSAIAIANHWGWDIVTSSTNYHLAVSTLNERAVLQHLLRSGFPDRAVQQSAQEKADEFAQVVVRTQFDVKDLTPEKIAELHKSEAYPHFKDALMSLVSPMQQIDNPAEREKQYELMAKEVIDKWEGTKKLLSVDTAKTLLDATDLEAPKIAEKLLATTSATLLWHTLGAGILVGVLALKGYEAYKKYDEIHTSSRFLSQLVDAGAVIAGGPIGAFAGNPEYGKRLR